MSPAGRTATAGASMKGAYVCVASPILDLKLKHVLDISQIFFFSFLASFYCNSLALGFGGGFMDTKLKEALRTVFRNSLPLRLCPKLLMIFSSGNILLMVRSLGAFCKQTLGRALPPAPCPPPTP